MSRDEYSKSKVQIYSPISHFYKDHFGDTFQKRLRVSSRIQAISYWFA